MSQLPIQSAWIKASDFSEEPTQLVVAQDPEYKEGKTIDGGQDMFYFYYFMKPDNDQVYTLQSSSVRLANQWNEADPSVGDNIEIIAEGTGMKRQYTVNVLEA